MRDDHGGHPPIAQYLPHLGPHSGTHSCIKVAEGLIQQHDERLWGEGAANRNPLLLTA